MSNSRRDFLKQTLAGAAALGVSVSLPEPLLAADRPKREKKGAKAKRILMLGLDGICVEGFKQARTPNLDALLAEGALSLDTRVVMPSVTLPNWTSILCGSGPEVHGVVNNSWKIDKHVLPSVKADADGYYPSVFQILKENVPSVKNAFYWNWYPLANPYNWKHFDDMHFEEGDAYAENYGRALKFMTDNRNVPTVIFLYSVHTDHAGHRYAWMSPEYLASIEEGDRAIGELLAKMKEAGIYDDTHFFFLTDHGGINKGHGGVTTHEMLVPWGVSGPGIRKGLVMSEPNNHLNTASVILRLFGLEQPDCWVGEVPESIFA